ncbi:hypothetical protein T439DRAFT_354908 [Meredithblackwellia eburnea MCA 4105]
MASSQSRDDGQQSLPMEIIIRIIEISAEDGGWTTTRARGDMLARFSRVDSAWRHVSQQLLFSRIFIDGIRQSKRFIELVRRDDGGCRGGPLDRLDRVKSFTLAEVYNEGDLARPILGMCHERKVEDIVLQGWSCEYLRRSLPARPNFVSLRLTRMHHTLLGITSPRTQFSGFTFPHLRRLVLHDLGAFLVFDILFKSAGGFPAVTELIVLEPWEEDEYILQNAGDHLMPQSLAGQLEALLLDSGPQIRLPTFFRPFLASCTSLKLLDFSDMKKSLEVVFSPYLPANLRCLAIRCSDRHRTPGNLGFATHTMRRRLVVSWVQLYSIELPPPLGPTLQRVTHNSTEASKYREK